MIGLLLIDLGRQEEDLCYPTAFRVSLGDSYAQAGSLGNHTFSISFNTEQSCSQLKLSISISPQYKQWQVECQNRELTVSKDHFDVNYSFTTYVHHCRVNADLQISAGLNSLRYRVGNRSKSAVIPGSGWTGNVIVLGDWGTVETHIDEYDQIFDCLDSTLASQPVGLILFLGDFAYDMHSQNCSRYKAFLQRIEIATAVVPFLVVPGNHDDYNPIDKYLFDNTFLVPGSNSSRQYSFHLGDVLFIGYTPESQVYQGVESAGLYDFMTKRLAQPAVWKVPFSHYPFFCSHTQYEQDKQCLTNFKNMSRYRTLFRQKGVQLVFGAHEHVYERCYPVDEHGNPELQTRHFEGVPVFQFKKDFLSIMQGDAGNDYFMITEPYQKLNWTAVVGVNAGMGLLTFINETHLRYRRVKARQAGKTCFVWDEIFVQQQSSSMFLLCNVITGVAALIVVGACLIYFQIRHRRRKARNGSQERALQERRHEGYVGQQDEVNAQG